MKHLLPAALAALAAACAFSACGGRGAGSASQTGALPMTPASLEQMTPALATPTPLVIHVGFNHGEHTDPTFGPVYFYSPTTGRAAVIRVRSGSKVVFLNDDPSGLAHTGSGLGATAFPSRFDNRSGTTRSGTIINSSLTWSTGTLLHGRKSQVFTVGPRGHYFFGCNFHYTTKPTTSNSSMGDVLVSM